MATEVLMPALSPTMTEGKIARWLKSEGDEVRSGDVLAEIETDKATMEVEAVDEGVLTKIVIPEGTDHVAVNTPIAVIAANGEAAAGGDRPTPPRPHRRLRPPMAAGSARLEIPRRAHRSRRRPQRRRRRAAPPRRTSPNTPAPLARLPCARRCAMRSPRRCAATTRCF